MDRLDGDPDLEPEPVEPSGEEDDRLPSWVAPRAARDVPPGEPWAFRDHRTMAEVIAQGE